MRANGGELDGGVLAVVGDPVVDFALVTGDCCVTRKQLTTRLIREAAVETPRAAAMVKEGASNETIIAWDGNHHMTMIHTDEFRSHHIHEFLH